MSWPRYVGGPSRGTNSLKKSAKEWALKWRLFEWSVWPPPTHLRLAWLQLEVAEENLRLGCHNHFARCLSDGIQGSAPYEFGQLSCLVGWLCTVAGLPIAMQLHRGPRQILYTIKNYFNRIYFNDLLYILTLILCHFVVALRQTIFAWILLNIRRTRLLHILLNPHAPILLLFQSF